MKRLLALFMAAIGLSASTFAGILDLSRLNAGSVIEGHDYGEYYVDEGEVYIKDGTIVTGTLGYKCKLWMDDDATITLSNATIAVNDSSVTSCDWAGLDVYGQSKDDSPTPTIILEGTNTVMGMCVNSPGIHVCDNETLIIRGSGKLTAIGNGSAAGIGGGASVVGDYLSYCGDIDIESGIIVAEGGESCPGIGAAKGAGSGIITIKGGNITARGGAGAAGIGSGEGEGPDDGDRSYCWKVDIKGGKVVAEGGTGAAGIGAGKYGCCFDVYVTGGDVRATGGTNAAGIGNGWGAFGSVDGDHVVIGTGIARVVATCGGGGSDPIGSGKDSNPIEVTVRPSPANGFRDETVGLTRTIEWNGNLATVAQDVVAADGLTIYGTLAGNYKISIADGATVTLSDATITNGVNGAAGITCEGDATIILSGANTIKAVAENYPGIHVPEGHTLTIKGPGSLDVRGKWGAGIGGGYAIPCGNIVILGGTITAQGGNWAAGIGCGHNTGSSSDNKSRCGTISILGGNVTAIGGTYASGIGAGKQDTSSHTYTCCGDIVIAPGVTVIATKGSNGGLPISTGSALGYGTLTVPTAADGMSDTTSSGTRTIRPIAWDGNLATLTRNAIATDGMTIYNTLSGTYKVSIAAGATVTLSNAVVNLDRDTVTNNVNYSWAGINCLGDANIILVGTSTVSGFYYEYPGLHVSAGSTLTIDGSGTLNAIGTACGGAGIGGGWGVDCGNIVIAGGNIVATGANSAVGIGSGSFATCGDITISGGNVVATAGMFAAGIGSSPGGTCGNIMITGGTVDASSGDFAAGIGTGNSMSREVGGEVYYSICGDISIGPGIVRVSATGYNPIGSFGSSICGTVTVDPSLNDNHGSPTRVITAPAAWDGNLATLTRNAVATDGMTIYNTLSGPYKVSIAAGATVTLSNAVINLDRDTVTNNVNYSWAGINCLGDANIILAGTSTVSGFYKNYPGIHVPAGSALTIDGSGTLNAIGTDCGGAGIGGGWEVNCGNIVIAGGKIVATGADSVPGIGVGSSATGGVITISGGNVTATGGMGAAGIGSGLGGSTCGDITITGGIVDASGGPRAAGIGRGASAMYQDGQWYYSTCGDISIGPGIVCVSATGDIYGSTVTVDSSLLDDHGYPTRVITAPGAWDGNLATLTHNAIATDGMTIYNTLGGIYKVSIADGATVTLSNAVVNLDRDSVTNNSSCSWAGINCVGDATLQLKGTSTVSGFYLEYPGIHVPENSTLTINGNGTLNAIGTDCGGAGIGGGWGLDCGNIVIAGGNIVATGANSVPGIGVGSFATGGNITISGGDVTATAGMGAAGIGSGLGGSECGDITITGGTVDARGGASAPGIGSGVSARYEDGEFYHSICGDISIGSGIVRISATGSGGNPIRGNGAVTVDSVLVDRTSADGMTRTITAAGNTNFLPGDRTTNAYSTQSDAQTAAASIQIVAPADVQAGLSSGDLANYIGCFTKKVVQNPAGEGYVVVVALTEQAEETLQEQADDDVADEILPAITSSEVTITTMPGFYYSVLWGDEPDCSDQTIPVLATGTTLTLELPKGENPACTFYKLVIDFTR